MIYIVFSINWPVPPKHDHQQFLKKEKISSTYPGVSKFSTNQKPVFYRCFQNLELVLGCKRVQEKAKQGVLCFFPCVCSVRIRTCVSAVSVWCVPCMRAYPGCVCILFAFVFVFLLFLLFFILVFNFVLFCFVFFLLLFQRKALVLFACALYVCVLSSLVYARVRADCPRAC